VRLEMGFPELDTLLVIDIEATCWESAPPSGQESDIIEIGLAILDTRTLEVAGQRSVLVRPERSTVSPFCTKLTSLTQEDVDGGVSIAEACRILKEEYDSEARAWASYGDYDRLMFERTCSERDLEYPFGPTHLNVKVLLSLALGLGHTVDLPEALQLLGRSFEGTHHRGVDDAWNIAQVLAGILRLARGENPDSRHTD
jgi:inhibitor of KinA sporulation pathway (predicted exonuclease)